MVDRVASRGTEGVPQVGPRTEPKVQREYELKEGVEEAIREIKARLSASSAPLIVGVAGGSASGKTSMVAERIKRAFGADAAIISIDDYEKGMDFVNTLPRINGLHNFDTPEIIEMDRLAGDIKDLKAGKAISKPEYDFHTGHRSGYKPMAPAKVIIIEGLYALGSPIVEQCDVKLFVEARLSGQMIRKIIRDAERTGLEPTKNMRLFVEVAVPGQLKNVNPTKPVADIVIKNHYNPYVEAQNMKAYDCQVRFMQALDEKLLQQMGAVKVKTSVQLDEYYRPDGMDTKKTGELMRFRHEDGSLVFCYKGPSELNGTRLQRKLEFEFDHDPRESKEFLRVLSWGNVIRVEKQRTTYELDGVRINIDKGVRKTEGTTASVLGDFVELVYKEESIRSGKVAEITGKLGLSGEIRVPYVAM